MKMTRKLELGGMWAVALLAALAGPVAHAVTIVTTAPAVLSNSNFSYRGSFDISRYLTGASGNSFIVTSATLAVNAYSPPLYDQRVVAALQYYTTVTPYRCGLITCYSTTSYSLPIYANFDMVDSLSLASGSVGTGGISPLVSTYDTGIGNYSGDIDLQLYIPQSDLASINSSGSLSYYLSATTNSTVSIDNVSLTFALAQQVTAVPEPSAWLMMLAGFGMVSCAMRRRRVGHNVDISGRCARSIRGSRADS